MKIFRAVGKVSVAILPLVFAWGPAEAQYKYPDACVADAIDWANQMSPEGEGSLEWYEWIQGALNTNCPAPGGNRPEGVGGTGNFPDPCPGTKCNYNPNPPTRIPPRNVQ